ncbi:hypothetical protein Ngar_c12590 [Candidatus Nitrososphaera gargensis Ga9.2]|uniref:Uncharacterized protein n=1 Tax=Nitrososphaera gargensis (strain Ga9.2) TaxID=1237085 RepID=K0IMT8_NITGG|nr:hypothetical protein [Candidatus Nitrososphaera gargensis]AFU58199.1 hypothetical protein Ngar_c12590 [Candidatus Nitrososphaera gargensis Ga9.2]
MAGELPSFWSQLGFVFGKFPFVGSHLRELIKLLHARLSSNAFFGFEITATVAVAAAVTSKSKAFDSSIKILDFSRYAGLLVCFDSRDFIFPESKFKTMQDNITS